MIRFTGLFFLVLIAGTVATFVAAPSISAAPHDLDRSSAALKQCLEKNKDEVKDKHGVNISELIKACQSEYQAFLFDLPSGARKEVKKQLKKQLTTLLDNS